MNAQTIATVIDSLLDEVEAVMSLVSLVEDAVTDLYYQGRLLTLELALDKLAAGMLLDEDELAVADFALRASENNCRELGLDDEADEYEAARIELEG